MVTICTVQFAFRLSDYLEMVELHACAEDVVIQCQQIRQLRVQHYTLTLLPQGKHLVFLNSNVDMLICRTSFLEVFNSKFTSISNLIKGFYLSLPVRAIKHLSTTK